MAAIVVMDLQAEGARAMGDGLADAAHADDAEPLAGDSPPEHPGWRPAGPMSGRYGSRPFDDAPRDREDERDRHVGRVLGEHARRVGDRHAAAQGRRHVDIIDAGAEIGDELHLLAGESDQLAVNPVGHGRHEHVGGAQGGRELIARHWLVLDVELRIEKLAHPRFNDVGQFTRYDNERFLPAHLVSRPPDWSCAASRNPPETRARAG